MRIRTMQLQHRIRKPTAIWSRARPQRTRRRRSAACELTPDGSLWTTTARTTNHSSRRVAGGPRPPRVLATFTNKRLHDSAQIGRGQVLFVSSGVFAHVPAAPPGWNNLATTDAVLLFDRIFRDDLQRTLPRRNLESVRANHAAHFARRSSRPLLAHASQRRLEPLAVDALGADAYGVSVRNASQRGHYRVTAYRPAALWTPAVPPCALSTPSAAAPEAKQWEAVLAVNGPQMESELKAIDETALKDRMGDANYRWVAAGAELSLEGAAVRGQDLWKWLMAAVFMCLLVELVVLAWPAMHKRAAA